MKILLGLAAACLVAFVALVTHHPHIDYGDFETSCRSAASPGGDGFLRVEGGSAGAEVVRGRDAVDRERFPASLRAADCADRRTQVVVQAQLVGMAFAACLAGAVLLAVRPPREQAPAYVAPDVPSA